MEPTPDLEMRKSAVYDRVKNSFGSDLVSALGVVQGVALAELGAVIIAEFPQMTLVRWLQAIATFFVLIAVWDTITKDGLIWRWIPGFQESLIPFVLGGAELYLSYSITLDVNFWLFGMAGMAWLRGIGYWHVLQRGKEEQETAEILQQVKGHFWVAQLYSVFGTLVFIGLAVGNLSGIFAAADATSHGVVIVSEPLVVLAWIVGALVASAIYWRKIITYIRPAKSVSSHT